MKKIIIGSLAVVATVIPLHVSLVSAADGFFGANSPYNNPNPIGVAPDPFFGNPGGAVQPGIDRTSDDDYFFGSRNTHDQGVPFGYSNTPLSGGTFFGPGSSYNADPIGTCDYFGCPTEVDPFDPCTPFSCGLPCDSTSWCTPVTPVTPAPEPACEWYTCGSGTSGNGNSNTNNNDNTSYNDNSNYNNIVIKNYIQMPTGAAQGGAANRVAHAPVIVSAPVTSATENRTYTYQVIATDADGDVLSYSLVANPDGMTIDAYTGLIRWTPSRSQRAQAHAVTVFVSDGARQAAQSFQVFVSRIAGEVVAQETATQGRVAGASAVNVAEASDKNTLRAYNIRVDTDELGNSVVSWDTTKPSRGRVMFGRASQGDRTGTDFTGAGQYEFATPNTPETSTSHRVILGQLEVERVYYFRVVSIAGTDTSVSSERSFVQLGNGDTLGSDAGFASVIGTLGGFLFSSWFLFLMIIVIVLIIVFRRRNQHEIVAHAPVEMHVGGGHH